MTAVTANANMLRIWSHGSSIVSRNIYGDSHRHWLSATGAVVNGGRWLQCRNHAKSILFPTLWHSTEGVARRAIGLHLICLPPDRARRSSRQWGGHLIVVRRPTEPTGVMKVTEDAGEIRD